VRADGEHVEGAEEFVDAVVDAADIGVGEQSARDTGLLGDDAGADAAPAQQVERLAGPLYGADAVGVGVVRDVFDERAVAVEQHGLHRAHGIASSCQAGV
jgi:hypothetical protein